MKKKYVIKASGEQEEFNIEKFRRSLRRCGAPDSAINRLAQEVQTNPNLITTKQIYKFALQKLCKISRPVAARYNLKQAIFDFGPTGFPFERYVAELYKAQGFTTEVGKVMQGRCVSHETDVIAHKDNNHFLIECKFHNHQGIKSPVQTPLYVKARFEDLVAYWQTTQQHAQELHGAYVITNTQFTTDARQYGECAGINMIDWSYPKKESLKEQIDTTGAHPVTALTSLTKHQKKELLYNNCILCRDVPHHTKVLKLLGLSDKKIQAILAEAKGVCEITSS